MFFFIEGVDMFELHLVSKIKTSIIIIVTTSKYNTYELLVENRIKCTNQKLLIYYGIRFKCRIILY